jgi:hypothetical protein
MGGMGGSMSLNSYEFVRSGDKMPFPVSIIMIFKSSLGILFLALPFFFSKTGFIAGKIK